MAAPGPEGYTVFPAHPATRAWAEAARAAAVTLCADPSLRARWLRHGGTWFAGVDVLPNAPDGSVAGTPLAGPATEALPWQPAAWHAAQVSVTYPGYPQPDPDEPAGAVRFRRERDAAHVDGLLPVGAGRRRMLREPHAWVLGLPLSAADPGAAPLTVWPGSHRLIGAALRAALAPHPPEAWPEVDLTDAYAAARRAAFAACPRVPLPLGPGMAVLLHRHLLHGVAPWAEGARAAPEGRMVAYFRPLLPDIAAWAEAP